MYLTTQAIAWVLESSGLLSEYLGFFDVSVSGWEGVLHRSC
ncbi:hypothetical protein APHWEB_0378 [Anaplasma phagocytophilum str. Webster]|nr:hypothetical protein APHWEB_0378 [Anaplasma phagocytophilum str. Webster]